MPCQDSVLNLLLHVQHRPKHFHLISVVFICVYSSTNWFGDSVYGLKGNDTLLMIFIQKRERKGMKQ
jgi:hypothetical protein